ncbi:hypothetical protein [Methylocucumis oryzae]|uniref:Lipoprotein n=1 Tax=Methylocucumis oryzae TaxID=1632867 RepID=A0A0F3IP89_9GAMM|nr:hypothetical protein [Methylocucumis oryzae]KJV07409.1 hypothetical protein VZ94_04840 [Methylocucumis oryzae]
MHTITQLSLSITLSLFIVACSEQTAPTPPAQPPKPAAAYQEQLDAAKQVNQVVQDAAEQQREVINKQSE